jgi:hypothetical protein
MLLEYQNICITDSSGTDHHHIRHSACDLWKAYNDTTIQGMQPWDDRKSWPQLLTECCKCRKCCKHFEHNLNTEMWCHIERDVKYAQYLWGLEHKVWKKTNILRLFSSCKCFQDSWQSCNMVLGSHIRKWSAKLWLNLAEWHLVWQEDPIPHQAHQTLTLTHYQSAQYFTVWGTQMQTSPTAEERLTNQVTPIAVAAIHVHQAVILEQWVLKFLCW